MPRYIGIAMTNPVEGREQEFNEWYDNQHIPDVLAIPGNVSAQRFKAADSQLPNRSSPYRYLAVYEVEVDDLKNLITATVERGGTPAMSRSDSVAWDNVFTVFFEPIGPKIEKKS
jgi:hypothetical protein